MSISIFRRFKLAAGCCLCLSLAALTTPAAQAQLLIPGTGQPINEIGDDFEDPAWSYVFNGPKNSKELDGRSRLPNGYSSNRRWFEGPLRGQMDVIERVATPLGGLPESEGSLLLRSVHTGSPGRPSGRSQQDDLCVDARRWLGRNIPVSWGPSFSVRVYVPPFAEWENRTGNSFAVRAGAFGSRPNGEKPIEEYWPGMFLLFRSETSRGQEADSAYLVIRANQRGGDIKGPEITETGWWTFGMSFPPSGEVQQYASPGVDDLTAEDLIYRSHPYGFRCTQFETLFFNVMSGDDGRTPSTTWILDDPTIYVQRAPEVAQQRGSRSRSRSGRSR